MRTADATGEQPTTGWKPWYTLWGFLFLGWTFSAADRALTGPVVTYMIQHKVDFLATAPNPHGLGGLIGGLFFAGYMLTQLPGGYLGDRFGHRSVIVVSLVWAGIATLLTGLISGLILFIVIRVLTGLGEGAYYSNDRSVISSSTPVRQRSIGMGVAITGLAVGITIATVGTPWLIQWGRPLVSAGQEWRSPFLILGVVTLVVGLGIYVYFRAGGHRMQLGKATVRLLGTSAIALAAVMAVYFAGRALHFGDIAIAVVEVGLAVALMAYFLFGRGADRHSQATRSRDLWLVYLSMFAVLWNLWFFGFWSVAIIADTAKELGFAQAALVAGFNAGAGILGFPTGGWLSDYAVRRGWGRKPMLLTFTLIQGVLTAVFGYTATTGKPNVVLLAVLLFTASLFFNALQPISHALLADLARPEVRGTAFGMSNLVGETGAVLSPAISGVLRDVTGSWAAAIYLDAAIILTSFVLITFVRERQFAHREDELPATDAAVEPV
ncbi:MFS transporter [Planosporangium mesophilum]|nr:MFS transporter [Planosporangium mesophilum]